MESPRLPLGQVAESWAGLPRPSLTSPPHSWLPTQPLKLTRGLVCGPHQGPVKLPRLRAGLPGFPLPFRKEFQACGVQKIGACL